MQYRQLVSRSAAFSHTPLAVTGPDFFVAWCWRALPALSLSDALPASLPNAGRRQARRRPGRFSQALGE
ncbi:MAG: hypothetical protein ACYCV7_09125 [Acidimicrobiales bacterium]